MFRVSVYNYWVDSSILISKGSLEDRFSFTTLVISIVQGYLGTYINAHSSENEMAIGYIDYVKFTKKHFKHIM